MPLKIAAYLRVSTEEQAEVVEGSLDNQKYRMTEFVRAKNFEGNSWGKIVDFYVDDGYSAKDTKRPAYQRMMTDLKKGKVNLILVTDLSRLSRNIRDFSNLLSFLEENKSKFLSMKEQFDTSTPAGKMMIFNMINLAQFEREQTAERVALNCHARAMRGFVNGGKAILGYEHSSENSGVLQVNDDEAAQVKVIFDKFLELGSRGQTIKYLHSIRLFPKSYGAESRSNRWTIESLGNLLSHGAYIGLKEVNRGNRSVDQSELKPWQKYKQVKASWPAILDRDIFDRAQVLLAETANFYRQRRSSSERRVFLLSGMLTCGECGRPLMGQTAHGKTSKHRYYIHGGQSKENKCAITRYRADELEETVTGHLLQGLAEAGYFESLSEKIKKTALTGNLNLAGEMKRAREAVTEMDQRISRAYQIQSRGQLTQEALQVVSDDLNRLALEKKALKEYIEELEAMKIDKEDVGAQGDSLIGRLVDFQKGWAKAPSSKRKVLLRRAVKRLVTMPDGIEMVYRLRDGLEEKVNRRIEVMNARDEINVIEATGRFCEGSKNKKPRDLSSQGSHNIVIGRGDRIRTYDPLVPNQMRYQTALLPDRDQEINN